MVKENTRGHKIDFFFHVYLLPRYRCTVGPDKNNPFNGQFKYYNHGIHNTVK